MNMLLTAGAPITALPFQTVRAPRRPYTFSCHGLQRLHERAGIPAEEVLALLEADAYVCLARRISLRFVAQRHPEVLGMTFAEAREQIPHLDDYKVCRLMIWSRADQRPLTLVVSEKSGHVITVVHSETQEGGHDWSDQVTPERIARVRHACEQFHLPPALRGKVYASAVWLTPEGMPLRKKLPGGALAKTALPLAPDVLSGWVEKALAVCGTGYDLRLRLQDDTHTLYAEYAITRQPGGAVAVELVELASALAGGQLQ